MWTLKNPHSEALPERHSCGRRKIVDTQRRQHRERERVAGAWTLATVLQQSSAVITPPRVHRSECAAITNVFLPAWLPALPPQLSCSQHVAQNPTPHFARPSLQQHASKKPSSTRKRPLEHEILPQQPKLLAKEPGSEDLKTPDMRPAPRDASQSKDETVAEDEDS